MLNAFVYLFLHFSIQLDCAIVTITCCSNVDMVGILSYLNISLRVAEAGVSTASTFAVAYAVHKVFAPVRIGITLTCAPFIVKALRARGILKAPKPTAPKK